MVGKIICVGAIFFPATVSQIITQDSATLLMKAEKVIFKRSKNEGGNNIQRKIFSLFDVLKEKTLEDVSVLLIKQNSESIRIIFFSLTKVLEKDGSNSVYHKAVSTAKRIQ